MSDDLPEFPGDEGEDPYFTAAELAERWKVDRKTVYRRSSTALPCIKIGPRTKRYRREDVLEFEQRNWLGPESST